MPVLGKEVEPRLSPEQIAVQEVQGYVEKVERQAETQQPVVQQQPPQQITPVIPVDMGKTVSGQFANTIKPKIVLPVNQDILRSGLKKDVSFGIKWLSEWCVMMIKKYPGRVFYLPIESKQ